MIFSAARRDSTASLLVEKISLKNVHSLPCSNQFTVVKVVSDCVTVKFVWRMLIRENVIQKKYYWERMCYVAQNSSTLRSPNRSLHVNVKPERFSSFFPKFGNHNRLTASRLCRSIVPPMSESGCQNLNAIPSHRASTQVHNWLIYSDLR